MLQLEKDAERLPAGLEWRENADIDALYECPLRAGRGANSRTTMATRRSTGAAVVLKYVDCRDDQKGLLEYEIQRSLPPHPHLLPATAAFVNKARVVLELPRAERTLSACLYNLAEPELRRVFRELLCALATMHAHGVVHCDVKPDNVLLFRQPDGSVRAVLADFGSACRTESDEALAQASWQGTEAFMPPEALQLGHALTGKADVFALGLCLAGAAGDQAVFQGDEPAFDERTLLGRTLNMMLRLDPEARPSAAELLAGDSWLGSQTAAPDALFARMGLGRDAFAADLTAGVPNRARARDAVSCVPVSRQLLSGRVKARRSHRRRVAGAQVVQDTIRVAPQNDAGGDLGGWSAESALEAPCQMDSAEGADALPTCRQMGSADGDDVDGGEDMEDGDGRDDVEDGDGADGDDVDGGEDMEHGDGGDDVEDGDGADDVDVDGEDIEDGDGADGADFADVFAFPPRLPADRGRACSVGPRRRGRRRRRVCAALQVRRPP